MTSIQEKTSDGKIRLSEWQVWFSFSGRINRTTYWLLGVTQLTAVAVCTFLLLNVLLPHLPSSLDRYLSLVVLALVALSLWVGLAVSTKRWHDRNRSAWWLLLLPIPLVGLLWTLVEGGFLAGRPIDGPNRYGHPQR